MSPVFESKTENAYEEHRIDTNKRIAKVVIQVSRTNYLNVLTLRDTNNANIMKGLNHASGNEITQSIEANEAIIGLYGVKGSSKYITSLGFIVMDTSCFN